MAKILYPVVTLKFIAATDPADSLEGRKAAVLQAIDSLYDTLYFGDLYHGSRQLTVDWVRTDEIPEALGEADDFEDENEEPEETSAN